MLRLGLEAQSKEGKDPIRGNYLLLTYLDEGGIKTRCKDPRDKVVGSTKKRQHHG